MGWPRTRRSGSSAWSTAAAPRRARSWRAPCRTPSRATLVGETSFGKGTVQQWQELTGEGGALRLDVARWLTPDKRWIHEVGLSPMSRSTIPTNVPPGDDPVLDKALELLGERSVDRRPLRIAA